MDGPKTAAHEARPADTRFESKILEAGEGRANRSLLKTRFIAEFKRGDCHHRVIFGEARQRRLMHRSQGHLKVEVLFQPGDRFVLDLWRRNTYGTLQWRCYVCEALSPGEVGVQVPRVSPGARVLLETKGAQESRLFLAWAYALRNAGSDLLSLPRECFEAAHFRLRGSPLKGLAPKALSGQR